MPTERDLVATRLLALAEGETLSLPCQVSVVRSIDGWSYRQGDGEPVLAPSAERAAAAALKLAREARAEASKLDRPLSA